jgi:hypothetical protein
MSRPDGQAAHAVLASHTNGAILVWFINDHPIGYRTFSEWADALRWSDQLQAQNWAVGWRLASD